MTQQMSDWIDMSMSKGGSTDSNQFEADPGTYQFRLVEIIIDEGSDYEDKTKKFPQAKFVWEDADGDRFYDSFNKVPLGLKLNEKAAWTNRLSALVGRPLTTDDRVQLRFSTPYVTNYNELAAAVSEKRSDGGGAFVKAEVAFEGQPLIGREALLTLGWNAKGTHLKCAAGGAAPVPNAGGKKKRPADAAPQAASQPPARPERPAPMPAAPAGGVDLPF